MRTGTERIQNGYENANGLGIKWIQNAYRTGTERKPNGYRTGTRVERQQKAFCQALPVRFF